jgi:hypothetical protein
MLKNINLRKILNSQLISLKKVQNNQDVPVTVPEMVITSRCRYLLVPVPAPVNYEISNFLNEIITKNINFLKILIYT